MGFVSSLLGIANKVGGIANKFINNTGVASGVSKAANLVSTVVPKISPVVNAITTGAKLAYQTGIADKLTGGKATRLVKGVQNMFSPPRGVQQFSPPRGVQQNNAAAIHQAGATTGTKELARIM